MLENLLSNAVKYGANDKSITHTMKSNDVDVILRVHNEGRAISAKDQERLFDAFKRSDSAHKEGQKGFASD
ncbi:MAG: sensor histidine kinase [Cryobacterium sp.]|nr:sensor histidine kinase [Oligoflexia bacterium]